MRPAKLPLARTELLVLSYEVHHEENYLKQEHESLYHVSDTHDLFTFHQPWLAAVPYTCGYVTISGKDWLTSR